MQTFDHKWNRRQLEKNAKGKHTAAEIMQIVLNQKGRCFYCNRRFSDQLKWTRDHVLPLSYGGTHFASNLIAACRSCNSKRQEIPFFTYCRLLSITQYRMMMKHLKRRMNSIATTGLESDRLLDLYAAFTLDDQKHPKYLYSLKTEKKKHVAKLLNHPDLTLRKHARRLFYGKNSWIAITVESAVRRAMLLSESEGQ